MNALTALLKVLPEWQHCTTQDDGILTKCLRSATYFPLVHPNLISVWFVVVVLF